MALLSLDRAQEALEAYEEGLKVSPGQEALVNGVNSAKQALNQQRIFGFFWF